MKTKTYRIKNTFKNRFLKWSFDTYEDARSFMRKRLRQSALYNPKALDTYRNPRVSQFGYKIIGV